MYESEYAYICMCVRSCVFVCMYLVMYVCTYVCVRFIIIINCQSNNYVFVIMYYRIVLFTWLWKCNKINLRKVICYL